jgi:hypothetical protein
MFESSHSHSHSKVHHFSKSFTSQPSNEKDLIPRVDHQDGKLHFRDFRSKPAFTQILFIRFRDIHRHSLDLRHVESFILKPRRFALHWTKKTQVTSLNSFHVFRLYRFTVLSFYRFIVFSIIFVCHQAITHKTINFIWLTLCKFRVSSHEVHISKPHAPYSPLLEEMPSSPQHFLVHQIRRTAIFMISHFRQWRSRHSSSIQ